MSKSKFKSGDLVENIHTHEVYMVTKIKDNEFIWIDGMEYGALSIFKRYFIKLSPKSVKFNLK